MAWTISHVPEAWENAKANLRTWEDETLIQALVADALACADEAEQYDEEDETPLAECIRETLEVADHDSLVHMCMNSIRDHETCSNGGFDFWVDRKGYHTVPCDLVAAEDGDWMD